MKKERIIKAVLLSMVISYLTINYTASQLVLLKYRDVSIPFLVQLLTPTVSRIPFYFLLTFIFSLFFIKLNIELTSQFRDLRVGNKGNSRWTTLSEIESTYKKVPYKPEYIMQEGIQNYTVKKYKGLSGSLIARNESTAFIDTDDAHGVTIAPTRAGKGQTKVIPEIELKSRSEEQPHMIISSVKYELLELLGDELENRGYKIEVLNLIDLEHSFGYNALDIIKDAYIKGNIDEAVELCKTFTHPLYHNPNSKEPIWEESAMSLVNALILALCYEFIRPELPEEQQRPDMVTLNALVNMLNEFSGEYQFGQNRYMLDEYFKTLSLDNPARKEYSTVSATSGQMRSSIFGTAIAKLQKFTAPKVASMMQETTFSFENLTQSEQPYVVFIVLPDYIETNYIIASTWIQQCYYVLSNYASEHNDRLEKRVWFNLDEFGNLPALPNLNSMISVGAGRGILMDFIVQDLIQFEIKYGKNIAQFVETQLMNITYIKSRDIQTRERFSKMLGDEEVIQYDRSGAFLSLHKNISERVEKKPLLFPSELDQLKEGENVIIRSKRKTEKANNPNGITYDVIPYPILNRGKYRFDKAYEYLDGVFTRRNFTELNFKRHKNKVMSKEDEILFIETIRKRLATSDDKEVVKAEKQRNIEREIKEFDTILEGDIMMKINARYINNDKPLVELKKLKITDQNLGQHEDKQSMYLGMTYQELSNLVKQFFSDKDKNQFNQLKIEDDIEKFVEDNKVKLLEYKNLMTKDTKVI